MYHATLPLHSPSAHPQRSGHARVGVVPVWRGALTAFGAHAAPILLCALAGFALPGVLGVALDAPPLEAFIRGQSTFCAFQASPGWPAWVWGGLGLLAQVVAQGLITALALQKGPHAAGHASLVTSLRGACRAVATRFPALLLGWLPYVLLTVTAVAGLSVPLLRLHLGPVQLRVDDQLEHRLDHPVELLVGMLGNEVVPQGVSALLPDPGPLACGAAESVQGAVFRQAADPAGPVWQPASSYRPPVQQADTAWFWPVTLGSLALLLLAETLLRFRAVAALALERRPGRARDGLLASWAGVGLAWRHFGAVTCHVWLLRLATASVQVLFIVLPTVLAERLVIPKMGQAVWAPWVVPACVLLVAASVALVNGVLSAFAVVYDARLFAALQRPALYPP